VETILVGLELTTAASASVDANGRRHSSTSTYASAMYRYEATTRALRWVP
jgi:hypothetical protein